jgi:hypothetical protein
VVLSTIVFDTKEKLVKSNGVKIEAFAFWPTRCHERALLSLAVAVWLIVIYVINSFVT